MIIVPPNEGALQLVVDGNDIGNPKKDLIARNANA